MVNYAFKVQNHRKIAILQQGLLYSLQYFSAQRYLINFKQAAKFSKLTLNGKNKPTF